MLKCIHTIMKEGNCQETSHYAKETQWPGLSKSLSKTLSKLV